MSLDRDRLRRALNVAMRHVYSESALLAARPCEPTVARDQRPDSVLWSWINVSGAWTGTVAIVQPIDLAVLVVKQSRDGVKEPVPTELVLAVQGDLTKRVVGKTFDQIFSISNKAVLAQVRVGNGAPDVRRGNWQGHTWSVGGWWVAAFIYEGMLAAQPTPTATIVDELAPDTERVTNPQPLTKVVRSADHDTDVAWPEVLPSSAIPRGIKPAKPAAAAEKSPPPAAAGTPSAAKTPPSIKSSTSGRRPVVRTIHGLVDSDTARNLPIIKPSTPDATTNAPSPKVDADRTAPWFKNKAPRTPPPADFRKLSATTTSMACSAKVAWVSCSKAATRRSIVRPRSS
jgi:hypothetical protein